MPLSVCVAVDATLLAQSLPNDGLENQAQVLQLIVRSTCTKGYMPSVKFKDASREELRTILQHDAAFSNAMRRFFEEEMDECYDSILLILRYLCHHRSPRKTGANVHFAPEPQIYRFESESDGFDGNDEPLRPPQYFPAFVVSELLKLPNPWEGNTVLGLLWKTQQWAGGLGQEADEVQLVQFLSDLLVEMDLVPFHLLAGVGVAGFRDCLCREAALAETLHTVLHSKDDGEFIDGFCLVIRYRRRSRKIIV
ncbi:hypothetical protein AURDEDRAFT_147341 [Auricularia subglabra TFB-10046 SS5]|uniref:Uncharacterized protein n=1 Tax=Auricularia subglabra (strain TFB-10046 / SS5) TaxID=717982 RepID=J0WTN1_AURST|nr:hypothetical protein AURDEDRAFT_147341 [Auricularia subglabra TFB-10046 SS5]